jgi:phosphate starvation-inducible PhoH-like protein
MSKKGDSVLGGPFMDSQKKNRKTKKPSEKELLLDYNYEKKQSESDGSLLNQSYNMMQYLSANEIQSLEEKFTKPKNGIQTDYYNMLSEKSKKIVVATGPAGTGKTMFATETAVKYFLMGTYEKLVFTRPSVSVDEDLGYLPGTLEEKMAPWVRPIYDILYMFLTPKEVSVLMEEKTIEIAPLGYMRGRTFKNCWIVADEMQNSTVSQMKMLMTRLGDNSRLVITGDLDQHDRENEQNGLEDFLHKFKGKRSASISSVEFEHSDIQREDVVKEVLEIYSGDIPSIYNQSQDGDENDNNSM